jgi:hypothetical protein
MSPSLTLSLHVFAPHLFNMGNHRLAPCVPRPPFLRHRSPPARITLSDIVKDGFTYKNAFHGPPAADKIAYIIQTTDRNLALLLGRALDAQKYFHTVTNDHRLCYSQSDVYQFRTRVGTPFHLGELSPPPVTTLVPRVRGHPHRMHALTPVRLRTKRRTNRIQGNIKMRLLPPQVPMLMRTQLRT